MLRLKINIFCMTMLSVLAFGSPAFAELPASQKPLPMQSPAEFEGQAHLPFNPGAPVTMEEQGNVLVNGKNVPLRSVNNIDNGYMMPDGEGGMIWNQSSKERPQPDPNYVDAREFKLQVRELAEQLLANIRQSELRGKIGMPTSFVNQDNFEQSSAFGRYIAEQMFHEFNQRGFPVREYRIAGQEIRMREGSGDFYLSRDKGVASVSDAKNVILVGTYYHDGNNVFINARLIRPSDGLVYRTGQMVMKITPTTKTMLARTGRQLEGGTLGIRSKSEVNAVRAKNDKNRGTGGVSVVGPSAAPCTGGSADLSVLDQGYDIH